MSEIPKAWADLEADLAESDALRERMAGLLVGVAAALKGEPGPLTMHDWSDLPAVAAAVVQCKQDALRLLGDLVPDRRAGDAVAGPEDR